MFNEHETINCAVWTDQIYVWSLSLTYWENCFLFNNNASTAQKNWLNLHIQVHIFMVLTVLHVPKKEGYTYTCLNIANFMIQIQFPL